MLDAVIESEASAFIETLRVGFLFTLSTPFGASRPIITSLTTSVNVDLQVVNNLQIVSPMPIVRHSRILSTCACVMRSFRRS